MPYLLLGEPVFDLEEKPPLTGPFGQLPLCEKIHKTHTNLPDVAAKLRDEYLAVAHAMKVRMQLDFRVVHVVEKPIRADERTIGILAEALDCRLAGFPPDCNRQLTQFPCDFGVELPGISLLNPDYGEVLSSVTKGELTNNSPYGQAGRILHVGRIVLVGARICVTDHWDPPETDMLKAVGLKVGILPNPLMGTIVGKYVNVSSNDHLDRVAALILGRDNQPHLIIDPLYWSGSAKKQNKPARTVEIVRRICGELGVELHVPKAPSLKIPYSLNMSQFPDGRVLMTCGDEPVTEVVEGIVGKENLYLTEAPILLHPIFRYSGIRCLVGQVPSVFFKKRTRTGPGGSA